LRTHREFCSIALWSFSSFALTVKE